MSRLVSFMVLLVGLLACCATAQKKNYSNFPCPPKCMCFQRTVRCMRNDLTEIPKASSHTTFLDLRFNKIRDIKPGTFKGLKNVRSLLLNNNLLTHLKSGAFSGLNQVTHLYLYKNRIQEIDGDVFQNMPKLEFLYLHYNDLREIKTGTFSNIPNLERLFLYKNKISRVSAGAFSNLPRLQRLRLDANSLICDCKLAWLARMLKDAPLQVTANCRTPTEMSGKALKTMEMKDFHCKSPEIMEEPQDLEIKIGGTAIFKCHVEGDPSPSVTWMHNELELDMHDERHKILGDGSLMIRDSKDDDNGFYECVAKNPQGFIRSRSARMVVFKPENIKNFEAQNTVSDAFEKPVFIETPNSVTTSEGEKEIKFTCKAGGSPQPFISWSKSGIAIAPSQHYIIDSNGNLIIKQVQRNDFGTYRCDATNIHGRITATADLVINAPPVFTAYPESMNVLLGSTARFECSAVGTPPPEIIWYKHDIEVLSDGRINISEDGSRLEINNIIESDEAIYVCEARNDLGNRDVSAKLTIKGNINRTPKFVYKPYDMEAVVGSTIEIPCKAEGHPTPGVQWRKDGSTLPITGRYKTSVSGNLYIYNVAGEDQGRYECSANNDHGTISASGYITIKDDPHPAGINIGDRYVKVAFLEAKSEVDGAINRTINNLFHSHKAHGSADLFRLIRYPNAPARELARAAEVYERTLVNIRKHIEQGMVMNNTKEFNYRDVLSTEHLDLIAQLSGCMTHRLKRNCTDMCFHSKYRNIDGTCNNLQNPLWGASLTPFRRILKPIYENGFSTPVGWNKETKYYGFPKPSSRLISTTLISTKKITPDTEITHMVMQWGQFLDHDLDHAIPSVSSESWDGIDCKKSCDYAAPCYPIDVPPGDPRIQNRRCIDFVRSSSICGSGMTSVFFDAIQPREQINQLTSFIDASQVYGFSDELARDLRDLTTELGLLRVGPTFPGRKPLLPYASTQGMDCRRNVSESNVNCFLAGDIRANEQVGLIAMHTVWMREHNRLAKELRRLNPHWESDLIYQEARKIVGAAMQHITYNDWLPFIVGKQGMEILGEYKGYNPKTHPSIANVFATAALRFGHTLINPILHRLNETFQPIHEGHLPLHKAFFSPWRVVDEGGVDPLLRGLYSIPAKLKKSDQNLNTELTEQLFKSAHAVALDLAAINIHRSRDHAIPGYIDFRKFCNMTDVDNFDDLKNEITDPNVRKKLQELYGHPGNIDVWVGGVLEDQAPGAKVGPLFRCLLIEQFRRLRDGDRFYYENPSTFKPEQLTQIKQYSLARVLCDTGDNITKITHNVFILPGKQGGYVDCNEINKVDLRMWSECCSDCRYSGQLNTISRLNARNRRHLNDDISFPTDKFLMSNNTTFLDYDENIHLKQRIVKLEKTVQNMQNTIRKMNKIIKKLERDELF
ncbi:peroxidasin [Onthophagus taurus]|uniref:peroxidasin n=1 Tax=Onthophagus taurus TaxID=166361 RepID=UPI0039BE3803